MKPYGLIPNIYFSKPSGLGDLAILPQEVLRDILILSEAGAHPLRILSRGFKHNFDNANTELFIGCPDTTYPADIGRLIANVTENSPALTSITLHYVGPDAILQSLYSLKMPTRLQTLDLCENTLGSDGASSLAPSLMRLTGLHTHSGSFS